MTAATGLDPGLGNVLFDVWLVSRAVAALIDEAVGPAGLDADEFAVYSVLASTDGMTPTELSRWMAAPPTTVSSYVKRFERRGHAQRVAHPDDRRSYRVQLTAEGRAVHRAAGDRFTPVLEQVDALGGDSSELHRLLLSLHADIESITEARSRQVDEAGTDPRR